MPDPSSGITFRVIQEMMPDYHLAPDLLDAVVAALPPPPPNATTAWRHARLTRVIEEVAARVPMDAAQGHLAGQIAMVQFLADDFATRIHTPGLDLGQMCRLTRTTDALLHTVARMERTLERRQFRVMPFRDVKAVDGFDLAALDRTWCSDRVQQPATGRRSGGEATQRDAATPGLDSEVPDAEPAQAATLDPVSLDQSGPLLVPASGDARQPGTPPGAHSTARQDAPPAQPRTNPPAQPQTSKPTEAPSQPAGESDTTARRVRDDVPTYGAPAGSVVTRLEEGPGWTLDVIRRAPASGAGTDKAVTGARPGSAA
jgi:hypothetical protein